MKASPEGKRRLGGRCFGRIGHHRTQRLLTRLAPFGGLSGAFRGGLSGAFRGGWHLSYHSFAVAFREAAEQLRAGRLPVTFPVGSFPPALPFVGG
jgi:hypothetical protein